MSVSSSLVGRKGSGGCCYGGDFTHVGGPCSPGAAVHQSAHAAGLYGNGVGRQLCADLRTSSSTHGELKRRHGPSHGVVLEA